MSTPDERATWKALAEAAENGTLADSYALARAARTAVPALLADVERLERELAKERARHELYGLLAEEREADL